ncbi:MAG: hypothetical protein IJ448_04100 [Oscillospiraceae bacterium]|nr:hypothetical protein [Oscillospiraceae bacterium]
MRKPIFYTETAYFLGLTLLALGTALTEFGGWGISMVVAPAYILHLKLSQTLPFFSFGMAEYCLQAVVLLVMMVLLRKVRAHYFLSIAAALLYGALLDLFMGLTGLIPAANAGTRLAIYVAGVGLCAAGIALLFHAYLPPEAYELFVKELSAKLGIQLHTFKTLYDCASLALALGMSFAFFGQIRGIGVGTVVCAALNGLLIRAFSQVFEKHFAFQDRFSLRPIFTEREDTL